MMRSTAQRSALRQHSATQPCASEPACRYFARRASLHAALPLAGRQPQQMRHGSSTQKKRDNYPATAALGHPFTCK